MEYVYNRVLSDIWIFIFVFVSLLIFFLYSPLGVLNPHPFLKNPVFFVCSIYFFTI